MILGWTIPLNFLIKQHSVLMSDIWITILIWMLSCKSTVSASPCSRCQCIVVSGNLYKLAPKKECYIVRSCLTPHFTTFSHFWTCLFAILRVSPVKETRLQASNSYFFVVQMPERSRIARGLVKQQTSTPSASACQPSANVPLFTSSVQTCCPIQWHGVERPSCVLQDTWQPARQSVPPPPKCRAHFPSKRFFFDSLGIHVLNS